MDKVKYLEFIQGIISRLAIYGVLFRVIASICTAICLLGAPFIGIFLIVNIWWIDSFFLMQERSYRNLYDAATKDLESDYNLTIEAKYKASRRQAFLSKTFIPYYGSLVIILLVSSLLTIF